MPVYRFESINGRGLLALDPLGAGVPSVPCSDLGAGAVACTRNVATSPSGFWAQAGERRAAGQGEGSAPSTRALGCSAPVSCWFQQHLPPALRPRKVMAPGPAHPSALSPSANATPRLPLVGLWGPDESKPHSSLTVRDPETALQRQRRGGPQRPSDPPH